MAIQVEKIEKEEISKLHFPITDVLTTPEERRVRMANLDKAVILGNGYKGKVKIIFETTEGTRAVETTIWQASEDNILLKGGVRIPIHTVHEVLL